MLKKGLRNFLNGTKNIFKMLNDKKLKVCMISTMYLRYKDDTRGLMVSETNRGLIESGCKVKVVAPNDYGYKNKEIMDGVLVHRFNYFWPTKFQRLAYGSGIPTNIRKSLLAKLQVPFFTSSFLFKTLKVARSCDIIHAQWIFSGFIGLMAKVFLRKPVVVTVRRVNDKRLMKFVNRFVLKNADHVIFNSHYTMRECLKIRKPRAYSIINNSIDTDKFKPMKTDLKKKLGIKGKMIFTMGLLVEKKGFEYLIQAMPEILKKENATLVIGGAGVLDGKLKSLVLKLNLKSNVKFVGKIAANMTPQYYNACDLFVLPSIIDSKGETETLGVVLIEALSCGKPVVASRVGGIIDVVDSKVGVLVSQKDSRVLANAITKLLVDKKMYNKYAKETRKYIINKFGSEKVIERTIDVYGQVL